MRIITLFLISISFFAAAQKETPNRAASVSEAATVDSVEVKTIQLTQRQLNKLAAYEQQKKELEEAASEYWRDVVDSQGVELSSIIKMENGSAPGQLICTIRKRKPKQK